MRYDKYRKIIFDSIETLYNQGASYKEILYNTMKNHGASKRMVREIYETIDSSSLEDDKNDKEKSN